MGYIHPLCFSLGCWAWLLNYSFQLWFVIRLLRTGKPNSVVLKHFAISSLSILQPTHREADNPCCWGLFSYSDVEVSSYGGGALWKHLHCFQEEEGWLCMRSVLPASWVSTFFVALLHHCSCALWSSMDFFWKSEIHAWEEQVCHVSCYLVCRRLNDKGSSQAQQCCGAWKPIWDKCCFGSVVNSDFQPKMKNKALGRSVWVTFWIVLMN